MDMDSTAIQIECIDEIAKLAGVGDKVAAITERAMQGEMDFSESLKLRVAELKGADASIFSYQVHGHKVTIHYHQHDNRVASPLHH